MRAALLATLLIVALGGASARADVPPAQLAAVVLKLLSYDRRLVDAPRVVLAVVHRPGSASEGDACARLQIALEKAAAGTNVKVAATTYVPGSTAFAGALRELGASAAFVCVRTATDAAAIAEETRKLGIFSIAPAREPVVAGLAVGVLEGPSGAKLLVNLPAMKAEGASLSSSVLALAEVIR